jgi:excisionase family DNA binding protein
VSAQVDPFVMLADAIADRVVARLRDLEKPALLSIQEAAKYLGRGPGAVRLLIAKKILPKVEMGGRVMVRRADADRVIEASVDRG